VLEFLGKLRRCVVGLKACGGAHRWTLAIGRLGHEVKLMTPALVPPYCKGNKHGRNGADAVLEAASRPTMRFVTQKGVAQQDLLMLHRIRARPAVKSAAATHWKSPAWGRLAQARIGG
jgi:transposase